MKRPRIITTKLKSTDPQVCYYVKALEAENLKLHKRIAKLQAQHVSDQNRITALKGEAKKSQPRVIIDAHLPALGQQNRNIQPEA
jgi:hypothetical protein